MPVSPADEVRPLLPTQKEKPAVHQEKHLAADVLSPAAAESSVCWKCFIVIVLLLEFVVGPLSTLFAYWISLYPWQHNDEKAEQEQSMGDLMFARQSNLDGVYLFPNAAIYYQVFLLYLCFHFAGASALFRFNSCGERIKTISFLVIIAVWSICLQSLANQWVGCCSLSPGSMKNWSAAKWVVFALLVSVLALMFVPAMWRLGIAIKNAGKVGMSIAVAVVLAQVLLISFVDEPLHIHHWSIGWYLTMLLGPLHIHLIEEDVNSCEEQEEAEVASCCSPSAQSRRYFRIAFVSLVELLQVLGIALLLHGVWIWGADSLIAILSKVFIGVACVTHSMVGLCHRRKSINCPSPAKLHDEQTIEQSLNDEV